MLLLSLAAVTAHSSGPLYGLHKVLAHGCAISSLAKVCHYDSTVPLYSVLTDRQPKEAAVLSSVTQAILDKI